MIGRKFFIVSFLIMAVVLAGSCKKTPASSEKPADAGGVKTANASLVEFIKKQKLVNFQSTTIGSALDSYGYLSKKEWKMASLGSPYFKVTFTGWFDPETLSDRDIKDGVTGRGLDVTFVVNPDGSFYLFGISQLESRASGEVYRNQRNDTDAVLASIYANKKINL